MTEQSSSEMGKEEYEKWSQQVRNIPNYLRIAAEQDLWLQLTETRMQMGLSTENLAQRMGTSKSAVTNIEGI